MLQTQGVWIIELSELDSLSRAEVGRIKAFMSRTTDRFRPPYGKRLIESPRQCVFAGSVNHSSYLRDDSGGRRFWPVACARIDIAQLARDRDQLWAEAKARFERGCVWWLETTELVGMAATEQADRYEGDPWEEVVGRWIEDRSSASINYMAHEFIERRETGLYIAGSRVPIDRIIWEYRNGEEPEAIRAHYPTLSVEQVNGAIAFYHHHKEEVEKAMEDRRLAEDAYTAANANPPDIKQKFERMRRRTAPRRV